VAFTSGPVAASQTAVRRFRRVTIRYTAPPMPRNHAPPSSSPAAIGAASPALAVVIPVLNERDNIAPMVERLDATLAGIDWEAIFVDDDSTDGTREAVRQAAALNPRVRLLHRIGRRGLASAFIEGALASLAACVAAIDGDLQHDETLLPRMLAVLRQGETDIVVGSRHVAGGGMGEWDRTRIGMSNLATMLARPLLRGTPVTDPMSGFFMLRRDCFDAAVRRLSAMGFKILLDIIASLPRPPRVRELPYEFRTRQHGESKLDAGVLRDFALLVLDKLFGQVVPIRFVLFAAVGAVGIAAHLMVLRIGLTLLGLGFPLAQTLATACAIVGNFVLNNTFTFRDLRLRGWRALRGLAIFGAISAVGAAANVSISSVLFGPAHSMWWVAGFAGAAMSLVWNYAVSSALTWRR
jgi:dolichol-phosphate mannosyltransferase